LQSLCKKCLCSVQVDRWIKRKLRAIELKGCQCFVCGYKKNYAALDFHHKDESQKSWSWTKLRLRKWEYVVTELEKGVLLCKNCHYELHYPQGNLAQLAPIVSSNR